MYPHRFQSAICPPLAAAALCLVISQVAISAPEPDLYDGSDRPTWRLEYDNDIFLNSDNNFTSGLSLQRHSELRPAWSDIDLPAWMKFGRYLPGLNYPKLLRRIGIAVGQNIQTPNDLEATSLIVDDVPYAGSLSFEMNWLAFDDDSLRGYGLIVGVVGPASGAEAVQKWIHRAIDSPIPQGWDNQLPNELVVNLNGLFKRKFAHMGSRPKWYADFAVHGGFGAGTALIFAEAAIESRFGFNVPRGFVFIPDPVGRGIAYDATYPVNAAARFALYFSLTYRHTYMQHFIFSDGSLWQDTHSADTDPWQNQTIIGFHFRRPRWGIHFSFWSTSSELLRPFDDFSDDFGTIALDWRF